MNRPIDAARASSFIYATRYEPFLVALTVGLATFIVELLNYQMLVPLFNIKQLEAYRQSRFHRFLERYFNKTPFGIIAFVGFTPVPHLPFRLLAVTTNYSIVKYAIASFVGRASFYYPVAWIGEITNLPYWVYIILGLAIVVLSLIIGILHSRKKAGKENGV